VLTLRGPEAAPADEEADETGDGDERRQNDSEHEHQLDHLTASVAPPFRLLPQQSNNTTATEPTYRLTFLFRPPVMGEEYCDEHVGLFVCK